jgi:hypothetical protein
MLAPRAQSRLEAFTPCERKHLMASSLSTVSSRLDCTNSNRALHSAFFAPLPWKRASDPGSERRFHDVRDESGLPPTPERLRRRSEPTLRAMSGNAGWLTQRNRGRIRRTAGPIDYRSDGITLTPGSAARGATARPRQSSDPGARLEFNLPASGQTQPMAESCHRQF